MALIFDHAVKYNGKYYAANVQIEDEATAEKSPASEKPVEKAEKPSKRGAKRGK